LATFTGPYIDHRPIVTHFKREKDDKYLILATDGMWDELEDKTVSEVSLKHHGRLVDALFKSCIDSICDRNNVSF
jgi:pyruvate dehydrogenase phosphatase